MKDWMLQLTIHQKIVFKINMPEKVIHLYGNAQVNYKEIQLNAERIDFFWS
jgi:hypothetical protein